MTFHILGISSSQLTNPYFSEGLKPPTSLPFQQLTGAKYVGNGWVAGGCWDGY